MKRGRPPFGNIHALGLQAAARAVSDRIWAREGLAHVWMRADGGLIVRHHGERRFTDPGDSALVGSYKPRHATAQIEADLAAALAELAVTTASPSPNHPPRPKGPPQRRRAPP